MQQFLATLICSLCLASALHAEIRINTRFNPSKIALGNRSQYIVEIVESSSDKMPRPEAVNSLPIPLSGGLSLSNGRTSSSSQTNFVNGSSAYTHTQSLIIDAKAASIGTFIIPAFEMSYKGQNFTAPEAKLTVVERPADAEPTIDELIFLEAKVPNSLYIGQTVPVELKLYLSDSLRLNGLNAFDRQADGFIVSDLPDQSSENLEMIDGRRYRVLTWPLTITPIQTGQQDINFQFTVTARTGRNSDPYTRNSPFGRSLFDDFFASSSERFNVYTEPTTINVQALPKADKPTNFSGAIGEFSMQVYTDLEEIKVGEPIMLSIKLTGSGNFDRIKGPPIPESENWRSYDPESQFEASDSLGLKGMKRFDYVFIPRKSGQLQLPDVSFSFLDPRSGNYVQLKSPALTVQVSPNLNQSTPLPQQNLISSNTLATATDDLELSRSLTPEEALLILDYHPKPARKIDGNILKSKGLYLANAVGLLIFVGLALCFSKRKRLRNDANYALVQAAAKELKQARRAAASTKDAASFYSCAQQAVRLAATRRFGQNFRNAECPELAKKLTDDASKEALCKLFAEADAQRFAQETNSADLATARQQLDILLKAL